MSQAIIEVRNIGKKYNIVHQQGRYVALRDVLMNVVRSPFKILKTKTKRAIGLEKREEYWALKDINFTVGKGEVIGIIGRNGAGKSTLLKILSQITPPTEGEVIIRGRVGSLLEVGTGFHPELTGRENIFLNGAILGMTRREIARKFDEIVAFAGVGKFIDTPVKYFSSGMYVRLAFSVAAHMEPDILIVDEVLAVGDAEFQKKCLGKMDEISKTEGRTILFVSHDISAIQRLCDRSILLENGRIKMSGNTREVAERYLNGNLSDKGDYFAKPSDDKPCIISAEIETSEQHNMQINGKPLRLKIQLYTPHPLKDASLSFQIINVSGEPFVHLWTYDAVNPMCRETGMYGLTCSIPKLRLYMGKYKIKIYFTGPPGGNIYDVVDNICTFEVAMTGHSRDFPFQKDTCAYIEDCDWKIIHEKR